MHLLSKRAEAAIDRLTQFARGDQRLVNEALSLYYSGEVVDLIAYIREHRKDQGQPSAVRPAQSPPGPKV